MRDTTQLAQQKQLEIIFSKSESERALMGVDMIDATYEIVRNSIKQNLPEINERELVVEVFLRYYSIEFSPAQIMEISEGIRNFG